MHKFFIPIFGISFMTSTACQSIDNGMPQDETTNISNASSNQEIIDLDYNVDGEYVYEDGGMKTSLKVEGGKWRASTYYITGKGGKFDSSHVEYKSGVVKDKMLYDNSELIAIRPIAKNKININIGGKDVELIKKIRE